LISQKNLNAIKNLKPFIYFHRSLGNSSFGILYMRIFLSILSLIFLSSFFQKGWGQERKVEIVGQITDAEDGSPIRGVSIYNLRKGALAISDEEGKYKITATDYNRIVFSFIGYFSDTIRINGLYNKQRIDVQLHKNNYSFAPVEIFGDRPNYAADSAKRREWFAGTLDQGKTSGLDAISHPISALYDAISGRQKRIWRFQKDYEAYEQQKYINSRIRPRQLEDLFHLKGDSLQAFLLWYDPGYYFVRKATDYELLLDIKRAVAHFRRVYVMPDDLDFENQNLR